jgi:hypothetical protein
MYEEMQEKYEENPLKRGGIFFVFLRISLQENGAKNKRNNNELGAVDHFLRFLRKNWGKTGGRPSWTGLR